MRCGGPPAGPARLSIIPCRSRRGPGDGGGEGLRAIGEAQILPPPPGGLSRGDLHFPEGASQYDQPNLIAMGDHLVQVRVLAANQLDGTQILPPPPSLDADRAELPAVNGPLTSRSPLRCRHAAGPT